ncbi:GHKL domain-containing protein [Paenibacillus sp. FA6]|uniref:GHKL domain-containing protein n=1 Tax=Paenibacillus sp. FA6 TaxID=3413029 RepID=UPI003F655A2B
MDNIILEELFYAITLIALPFVIHYFYSRCFIYRLESKLFISVIYSAYYLFVLLLHFSPLPGLWLLALNTGSIVLLSFFYKGPAKWRIGAALFLVALILLSDVAMAPVYTTSGYITTLFLSKLLMFILVQISVRLIKTFGDGSLNVWYWIGLFCFPFISILGIFQLTTTLSYREYPSLYPVISSGMLFISFLIILVCNRVLLLQSAQNKNHQLEQQNSYYMNQYLLTKERQEEMFKFQHDFKNILLGLRAQLQAGDGESSLKDVDQLLGVVEQSSVCCNSGCIIIDSIINYKQTAAKKLGISFYLDINIPPNLELDACVMSIILGNTLDNAMESNKQPAIDNPYIKFQIHYLNEALFIRIHNPYQHKIRKNRFGDLYSTKKDGNIHGIGLKSVKKIVDECAGIWDISYENQIFKIEICLFNIGTSEN